jgi:hypothetical protein
VARPWIGRWSTYTVLGLVGYVVGAIVTGALAVALDAPLIERAIVICVPAFGFWFAISLSLRILGEERIVFYQAAFSAWAAALVAALLARADVARVSDLVIVLVASFLAFGRVGCFHVGCCHGRPARIGARYDEAHVRLGFPRRWVGRRIFPVQLVEACASGTLAVVCMFLAGDGSATLVFVTAYAVVRFGLELLRGDSGRPAWRGLSEAQWIALVTVLFFAVYAPSVLTLLAIALVAPAAVALFALASRRALHYPRHLDELERLSRAGFRTCTSAGLEVSSHPLPDARVDVIWQHDLLSPEIATELAHALFEEVEVLPASKAGMFHLIMPNASLTNNVPARHCE